MVVEVFKSIAKIAIVGVVVFSIIKGEISNLITLMDREVGAIFKYLMVVSFKIIIYVAPIMVILAVIDYAFQKWEFERNLKMTREEVKEEFRQTEGDPLVKARIRSLQRQMAKQRMMKDVPKADVIIKNPTHLAVALRYVKEEMHAPKVIAKGAGIIAEKIEEIAKSHGIPVIQNKKLAQALYKMVEIGEEIPAVLYQAVAEVLAYVYRLRGEMNE
ncbi:MAG: Flagellar biosynthetic protein FlhB [Candidatus Methanoperedenaceae archaeon GB37]|nr:MAG: Flagellar biosynthetic protein FlhB [Candidatus Methanoperedenaceae archaeon GB37]